MFKQSTPSETEGKYYSVRQLTGSNNPHFIKQMIQLFIKTVHEYTVEMDLAQDNQNLVQINQLAHRIKASIDILNIQSLVHLIREIESSHTFNEELKSKISITNEILQKTIQQMQLDFP